MGVLGAGCGSSNGGGSSSSATKPADAWCKSVSGDTGEPSIPLGNLPDAPPGPYVPGPDKPADMEQAAANAGVPVLDAEGLATHTHTQLIVRVAGHPVLIPEDIGIDEASGRIAALHTHASDVMGRFHVESPDAGAAFSLCQALAMWGIRADDTSVCNAFLHAAPCSVTIASAAGAVSGYDTILRNGDTLTVALTAGAGPVGPTVLTTTTSVP
jgi:hypothetical protein